MLILIKKRIKIKQNDVVPESFQLALFSVTKRRQLDI